ncbi:hypothetical protein CMQ_5139 [Grosmannia clavigera kw1407]|uniref:HEAT repeat domain-containing protein n=1 Tax=Grosmannia clavigera (strain kw1407 / UAMH 11150) TaxID=655863 RepID=F0XBE9_GROCL|nr:uncharacterized protein CMQ_5139 [Grosmannia clavigera kw1407]EFX04877.1 hypothetical protein CMQ_5139 [Grosmannia clavigera kw1407]
MSQDEPVDPLADIDSVDWAAVAHAYGPATDIPDALRRLQQADDVQDAYWVLYGNLYHQGTRYAATATAIPFLYRLLDDPHTPQKELLLEYLTKLAIGANSTQSPMGQAEAGWLETVRAMQSDPAYVDRLRQTQATWLNASTSQADRQKRERELQLQPKPEGAVEVAMMNHRAYAAVQAGVDSLIARLQDPAAVVRAHAAYTMAWFPAVQPQTRPALEALLATEPDVAVRASALFSLAITQYMTGDLAADSAVARLLQAEAAAPDADLFVRWVGCLGLLKLRCQTADQLALVARKLTDDAFLNEYESENLEERGTVFPFAAHDIEDLAALATLETAGLKGSEHPEFARAIMQTFASASGLELLSLTASCINIAFDGVTPPRGAPFHTFTPLQQELLHALLNVSDSMWAFANFTMIMDQWTLPGSKPELEKLVRSSCT